MSEQKIAQVPQKEQWRKEEEEEKEEEEKESGKEQEGVRTTWETSLAELEKGVPEGATTSVNQSTHRKSAPDSADPPPNGGLLAYLQVLGAFMLFFNTWGIQNTFGVYQTYYESGQLFRASSSEISWIGSIQSLLLLLTGVFSGPMYDRGHLRLLLVVGTLLIAFGHMMLSLCHSFWQALLAQGFVIGIGAGCLFIPAVAILPQYFSTKIGTVVGLAASGSSLGGVIYPIVFYRLIPRVGFPWAVRVLGFMTLGTMLIHIAVLRIRIKPAKARAVLEITALKDLHYMILVGGCTIGFAGLYVGFFYLSFFGQSIGVTDTSLSFYLVSILNAVSVFGRTLPNILADKIGPLNVIAPGAMIVSIVLFCLLAVNTAAGLIISVTLFGFFSGIFIALPPVCFVALTVDRNKIGTRIGMGYTMVGIGVLIGGPGGGGILQHDSSKLDWASTWVFAGAMSMIAGLVFLALRVIRVGFKPVKC